MKLVIGNSLSQLQGLTVTEFAEIREILSYTIDAAAAYHTGGRNPKRYLIDKKGFFPTGLLSYVYGWRPSAAAVDNRQRPTSQEAVFTFKPGSITPYPEQHDAVAEAVLAERGTICMPTGTGKSITMALLVDALQVRTLIVVPTLGLKQQLQATFRELFGSNENVVIENIDSPTLMLDAQYDCLIIDEAHHVASATYRKLNLKRWQGIYYRFFFTATPFRSKEEEQLLYESIAGQVVYRLEYKTAVARKFIVPFNVCYIDLPKTGMKGNPKSWPAVYSELIVNNAERNRIIAKLMCSVRVPTLCLVKEIKHGQILAELTGGSPFANGHDGLARQHILQFCLGRTWRLIGTTGVLGEGVDSKPAEVVILGGGGKSKNQLMQNLGRTFRNSPGKEIATAILFRDASNPYLLKHFNLCVKHIKEEYGVTPLKVDFS